MSQHEQPPTYESLRDQLTPFAEKLEEPGTELLIFRPDDPINTTCTDINGVVQYTVKTIPGKHHEHTHTEIRNADGVVIAALEWHQLRPDKFTLGDTHWKSIDEWMHRSLLPFDSDVTFKDDKGRKYEWKGNAPYEWLELYSEDTHYEYPIARFVRPHRKGKSDATPDTHFALHLTPRALEIRDTVVVAFIFLEKTRRGHEMALIKRNVTLLGSIGGGGQGIPITPDMVEP